MYQRAPAVLLLYGTMRRRVVGTIPGGGDERTGKLGSALSRLASVRTEDVAGTQVGDILRCVLTLLQERRFRAEVRT